MPTAALVLAVALALVIPVAGAHAASVRSFSPQGEAPVVRQARAVFSAPMAELGRAGAASPFAIECPISGRGHWADPATWVYDFERALPAGTRCSFTLRDGLETRAGEAVSGASRFAFDTGGPAILRAVPSDEATIHEDQAFVLALTGPVAPATLAGRAWCQAEGVGERIPAVPLTGPQRDALLKRHGVDAAHGLVLGCTRRLPNGAAASLVWDAGIATPSGLALRRRQTLRFRVRPTFQATLSCERENANASCTPLAPIRVEFTSAVERRFAQSLRLTFGTTQRAPDAIDESNTLVEGVRFAPPFPESAAFTLTLPRELRDADGREIANAASFPLASRTAAYPPLAKFASAPFGIVESMVEPVVLPVTLRYVERELGLRGLAPGRAALREIRLQDDAHIVEWSARLRQFHERGLGEDELRRAFGESVRQRAKDEPEPVIESRSVSLLARERGTTRIELPDPAGAGSKRDSGGWPFEVVGVPLAAPGFYVLELESTRLGEALLGWQARMYVRTSALVTNLAVHFKRSPEHSMAWVTALDTGRPVAQAQVQVSDCRGKPLWQGATDGRGLALVAQSLPEHSGECGPGRAGYFVSARATDAKGRPDLSFAWSDWDDGIEPWRFGVPTASPAHLTTRVHTVFDRTLLRAGETVSMKHLVRVAPAQGLVRPDDAHLPTRALVVHGGTDQTYAFDLTWKGAAAETAFPIPPGAKLGRYDVFLDYGPESGKGTRWWAGRRESGSFRVEAFRLPVYEGRLSAPAGPLVAPTDLALRAQVGFVGGGPAAALAMEVSALLRPFAPSFDGYEGFAFDRPDLRRPGDGAEADGEGASEGVAAAAASPSAAAAARLGVHRDRVVADRVALTLDAAGAGQVTLSELPALAVAHRLRVEGTYADPNGEIHSIANTLTLWPAAQVVGVRTRGWIQSGRQLDAAVAVLDTEGRPVRGAEVVVQAVLRKTVSHRRRLAGGFYAYEHATRERALGEACRGATNAHGQLDCRFEPRLAPGEGGDLLLIAQSADAQRRVASASTSVWLDGRGESWFAADNHDRIDVVPERKRYAPGETAKFQVRMPFRRATAWVAVEREGIVETRVVELTGRHPTLELPVQAHWGPNVYVSVLAVRGRLREVPWYSFFEWGWRAPIEWWRERRDGAAPPAATATIDLAKPAFRLGVAEIAVGVDAQRLAVDVTTDRRDYPVRGVAKVQVQVRLPDGRPAPAGSEVALAAVDEALLELAPNESWKLLEAMMQRRAYGVQTATAQMQVVGRRHFGRKALPAGGGGGRAPTRELFDTLLAWHPRLVLDARGRANVEVKLNDSLTGFRIVAVADAGDGHFGTGHASIRATQDLQVISGLPPSARAGDTFNAAITLRNATSRPMKATLRTRAQALLASAGAPQSARSVELPPLAQTLELPAGATQTVALPVRVPEDATELRWTLEASDAAGGATDRVELRQLVAPVVPPVVQQAMLARVAGVLAVPVSAPADALAGRSELRVRLSSSLSDSLDGVQQWFARYPYGCLEQRASRAVGLGDVGTWQALMRELPSYVDGDGLAQYFPVRAGEMPSGSEVLTAYLLAIGHESGLGVPAEQREVLLGGLARWVDGRIRRSAWAPQPDDAARRLAAIAALSRYGRAAPAMVSSLSLDPARLPASALIDWIEVLRRIEGVPRRAELLAQAEGLLRARLSYTGTRLDFVQEAQDRWWWLMASPDGNAARVLLAAVAQPGWQDEAPRLLAGLLGRMRRGAWDTTTANAWGVLAVRAFSAHFETRPVAGTTTVALQGGDARGEPRVQRWGDAPAARAHASFALPLGRSEATARIVHAGAGEPWAMLQVLAAVPLTQPRSAGYRLSRELVPLQRKSQAGWSRGDIVRVQLTFEAARPMTWVVLSDPLPTGASVLGSGLGRDATIAADAAPREGAAASTGGDAVPGSTAPTFVERAADAVRAYYEFLPAGRHRFDYVLRLNQEGEFGLPPTRAEAMYAPEVSGELPNARVRVAP